MVVGVFSEQFVHTVSFKMFTDGPRVESHGSVCGVLDGALAVGVVAGVAEPEARAIDEQLKGMYIAVHKRAELKTL